jgi:hypothetical protein
MLISNKHKFIFIHVPKNAGTSIHNALSDYSNFACRYQSAPGMYYVKKVTGNNAMLSIFDTHIDTARAKKVIGKKWDEYTSFAVVRNPYDRAVSRFFYFKGRPDLYESDRYENTGSFREHIMEMNEHTWNDLQSFYLEADGRIGVTDILRFEQLEDDWAALMRKIGLEDIFLAFKNRSERDTDFMKYYDTETIRKVNDIYRKDFELFGYEMV